MWEGWSRLRKTQGARCLSELRECREREEERRADAEGLGAAEELPLFLPTPSFMASADEG